MELAKYAAFALAFWILIGVVVSWAAGRSANNTRGTGPKGRHR